MRRWLCILAILLGAAVPVMVDEPAVPLDLWQKQKEQYEMMVKRSPALPGDKKLEQLLQFRIQDQKIVVKTTAPTTSGDGYVRVALNRADSFALMIVRGGAVEGKSIAPEMLVATVQDFSQPQQFINYSVNVSRQANLINLAWSSYSAQTGAQETAQLVQQSGGTNSVRLVVRREPPLSDGPRLLVMEAPDFASLVRDNRKEVETSLRPVLRRLGADNMLAPSSLVVWQVLPELWSQETPATQQVQALLPALAADDYRTREHASHDIENLKRPGAAALRQIDRSNLVIEQLVRIDRAMIPYQPLPDAVARQLANDPQFLLDCLYSDDLSIRQAALKRLREVSASEIQFDPRADEEARTAAVSAMRAKLVPSH